MSSGIYSIGVTGMSAAQLGLVTTEHNIANATTAGYNRQRTIQVTNVPIMTGAGAVGQGTRVSTIERMYSQFIAGQVNRAQAGVSELIERLPQGIDTPVGEGGAQLSGGERQRVAIARALIKNAPILLVDEATAALDAENQQVIAQTLARLRGRHTLVVIAHQLSTVAMADQILLLDKGLLVEQGSPAALRASNGRYAQFLAQRRAAKGWRIAVPTNGEQA